MNLEFGKMMGEMSKEMGNIFGGETSRSKKPSSVEELQIDEEPWKKPREYL